jgi:hypothetical protein
MMYYKTDSYTLLDHGHFKKNQVSPWEENRRLTINLYESMLPNIRYKYE